MFVDSLLAVIIIRQLWRWPLWLTAAVVVPLIVIDLTFVAATLMNFFQRGLGARCDRSSVLFS